MRDIATDTDLIDPQELRAVCGRFATGVTVITTRTEEGDHGMTASAFMSVSLDPPLICISVDRRARMLGRIRASGRYAVNILPEAMQHHALHFAGRPNPGLTDLFDEALGLPVLRDAAGVLVTDVVQEVETGDHVLFIGHVRSLASDPSAAPLLHHAGRFGSLAPAPAA